MALHISYVVENILGAPIQQAALWNNTYYRLFVQLPSNKLEDLSVELMTVQDVVGTMDRLRDMLSLENNLAGDIPKIEADRVRFWSKSFEPVDCSIKRDQEFRDEYKREINHTGEVLVAPNLETYLYYVLETLLYYCMAVQDEAIVIPINGTSFSSLRPIVGAFGTEENPPKLIPDQIAKYLIKHNNETTNNLDETKLAYNRILTDLCSGIEELNDEAKEAIKYLEWQDVLVRVDFVVQEWYRLNQICQQITTWSKSLTRGTIGEQTS